jgi:hypothetical protein
MKTKSVIAAMFLGIVGVTSIPAWSQDAPGETRKPTPNQTKPGRDQNIPGARLASSSLSVALRNSNGEYWGALLLFASRTAKSAAATLSFGGPIVTSTSARSMLTQT